MSDNSLPRSRARPRSKSFLAISQENPYARLEMSPLAPTSEIIDAIAARREKAHERLRAKPARLKDDPDEELMLDMDMIAELIGDDRKRARYDAENPQSLLLTVQPSAAEQAWRRQGRAGLISDWLNETADAATLTPTPRSAKLWAPSGLSPEMQALLVSFARGEAHAVPATADVTDSAPTLSVQDLDTLTNGS